MTHLWMFSIMLALAHSGHSFIGSAIARSALGMSETGTFLPFPSDLSNGRSVQEPTSGACLTGTEDDRDWAVCQLAGVRCPKR
jgi:hypothetical protein